MGGRWDVPKNDCRKGEHLIHSLLFHTSANPSCSLYWFGTSLFFNGFLRSFALICSCSELFSGACRAPAPTGVSGLCSLGLRKSWLAALGHSAAFGTLACKYEKVEHQYIILGFFFKRNLHLPHEMPPVEVARLQCITPVAAEKLEPFSDCPWQCSIFCPDSEKKWEILFEWNASEQSTWQGLALMGGRLAQQIH